MIDQAAELRQRMRRFAAEQAVAAHWPCALAVLGVRPTVGTTTLAIQLARELVRQGHSTALVDADPNGGAIARHCGPLEPAAYDLADVVAARATIHAALGRGPAGLHVVAGIGSSLAADDWTDAMTERLHAAIRHLGRHAKFVVLDAGSASISAAVRNCRHASSVLLVTTPDESALMETYAALKLLHHERPMLSVSLVVHRAADEAAAQEMHRRLADTSLRFLGRRFPLAGILPDASGAQIVAARAIERLASTLVNELACVESRTSRSELFEQTA